MDSPDTRSTMPDWHVESSTSIWGDRSFQIECDCPIGRDHTYAEWVARFPRSATHGGDVWS